MSATHFPGPAPHDAAAVLLEFQSPATALATVKPPALASGLTWLVLAMIASMVAAAALLPIDRVVVAEGRVIAQAPTIRVQPLEAAIVRSVEVRVGQLVRAGEVVARLDPTFAAADLAALEDRSTVLQAEIERLEAENSNQPYQPSATTPAIQLQASLFAQRRAEREFKMESYRQRLAGYEANIGRSSAEAQLLRERLQLAVQIEGMRRDLARAQVGSRLNALLATDSRVEITRALSTAESTAQMSREEMQSVRAERDAYDQQWRAVVAQELVDRQRNLAEVREQIIKARLRRELVELTSPSDAIVLAVARVSVGSVLASGADLITLSPLDAPLEIEAEVSGRDSGFVRVGQLVDIKFASFPFIRHGKAEGSVRVLSADSFLADEQNRPTSPFYRARVTVDRVGLYNMPEDFRLVPGMPVTVDIRVGERNALAYFFDRFAKPVTEAFREP